MDTQLLITDPVIKIIDFSIAYDEGNYAVKNVSVEFKRNTITAIMGPSGCGKSTLLRGINRMHELYPHIRSKGDILLNTTSIYKMSTTKLRRKIGMVFQRPNPFPTMSIYENVIAGYELNSMNLRKWEKDEVVEKSLMDVGLFDEVKDSLNKRGNFLSSGQQQRLCLARALALKPEVILLDEPTSALDPLSTAKIEDLLVELKDQYSIILVTHNMAQAARISNAAVFMYQGELVEYNKTKILFTNPRDSRTEGYLTGKFG